MTDSVSIPARLPPLVSSRRVCGDFLGIYSAETQRSLRNTSIPATASPLFEKTVRILRHKDGMVVELRSAEGRAADNSSARALERCPQTRAVDLHSAQTDESR